MRGLASLVEFLVVPVVFGATLLMVCVLLRLVPTRKSLLSPGKSKKVVSSPFPAWSCLVNTSVPPNSLALGGWALWVSLAQKASQFLGI